jgi:hypothetical protein
MPAKFAIAAFSALALIPAAATVFWPGRQPVEVSRTVALHGPITSFTQTRERIQVRLAPALSEQEKRARNGILVRDADGDELSIPLKHGQTWASARLPDGLATASDLEISVK